ncbi:MAG TPA: hypothetical protein ENF33_01220 [Nitrososphaeria archaeon]|nr:hypothetical protein [Nitrososphaeria archaeon]
MKRCVVIFSGGKESVFSLLEAKSQGYEIVDLLFLEKPGFSVHKVNLPAVKAVAKMLGYELKTISVGEEIEKDEGLIRYLREQERKGLNTLVTGNVKLEEHHEIYESLCERARLELVEPLKGLDTLELLMEYSKIDLQFMIIGIRDDELDSKWLGEIVTRQNFEGFLTDVLSRGIDPCGEYGEYHTLVTGLKEAKVSLRPVKIEKIDNNMNYILIDVLGNSNSF